MLSVLFRALSLWLVIMAAPVWAGEMLQYSLRVDGHVRRVLLYVPDDLPPGPRPLVMVLHGAAGSDRSVINLTRNKFEELADRDGWLVAFPNARTTIWRFANDPINRDFGLGGDDLRFFDRMLEVLRDRHPIDSQRIFSTGISRGGAASYYLACYRPGLLRAIAPVAMPMPDFMADACARTRPLGFLLMNGTADPLIPFEGGPIRVGTSTRSRVLSTRDTLDRFARLNGCETPGPARTADRLNDGMSLIRRSWQGCSAAPVQEVTVEGGGHTWPGGRQYLPRRVIGPVTGETDGMVEIWNFFTGFPAENKDAGQ